MTTQLTAAPRATYDLKLPHMVVIGTDGRRTVIQDGWVFEFGTKKRVGHVKDIVDEQVKKLGYVRCVHCGNTYTTQDHLDKHFYDEHRDLVLSKMMTKLPKEIRDVAVPREEQLREEAAKLAQESVIVTGPDQSKPTPVEQKKASPPKGGSAFRVAK